MEHYWVRLCGKNSPPSKMEGTVLEWEALVGASFTSNGTPSSYCYHSTFRCSSAVTTVGPSLGSKHSGVSREARGVPLIEYQPFQGWCIDFPGPIVPSGNDSSWSYRVDCKDIRDQEGGHMPNLAFHVCLYYQSLTRTENVCWNEIGSAFSWSSPVIGSYCWMPRNFIHFISDTPEWRNLEVPIFVGLTVTNIYRISSGVSKMKWMKFSKFFEFWIPYFATLFPIPLG